MLCARRFRTHEPTITPVIIIRISSDRRVVTDESSGCTDKEAREDMCSVSTERDSIDAGDGGLESRGCQKAYELLSETNPPEGFLTKVGPAKK